MRSCVELINIRIADTFVNRTKSVTIENDINKFSAAVSVCKFANELKSIKIICKIRFLSLFV